jgi:hypothetical protein
MKMHVVGISDTGTLRSSGLTPATLNEVRNPRVACFVAADPEDVQVLRSRFQGGFNSFLLLNDDALGELLRQDSGIRPVGQIDASEILSRHRTPSGVRGWLLFLCLLLMIVSPLTVLYQTSEIVRSRLWTHLTVGLLFYVVYLGLAGFSFAAGLSLLLMRRNAVTVAKLFLSATAIFAVTFYLWMAWRSWTDPTLDPVELASRVLPGPILFMAVWYGYLAKSKRVRNTYPHDYSVVSRRF